MAAIRSCRVLAAAVCLLLAAGCEPMTTAGFDPSSATYRPTAPRPVESVEHLTESTVYTIDARSDNVWIYFDFSRAAVVPVLDPKTDGWDLAFKRYVVRTNGGRSNPDGQGAVLKLARRDFAALTGVPQEPQFQADVHPKNRLHPFNPAFEKWYNYSYLANVLAPKPEIYVIRTQDGKYAKMRMLSYYCTGNVAGCMTFEYVYQGDGSRRLADGPAA
ncbi:MAG: HmuY family protein [Candidatus Tectomicrobia bacterium]|nr:HmuY family protein [Candidatus Tectomicrobia bacterium]